MFILRNVVIILIPLLSVIATNIHKSFVFFMDVVKKFEMIPITL